jgi:hypothetical protein
MKLKPIFSLLMLILFCFGFYLLIATPRAVALGTLQQQKEILRFEISTLRSLANNMRSQEAIRARSYIAIDLSSNAILLE